MVKINPGEIICDKCNGTGLVDDPPKSFSITGHIPGDKYRCQKCKGTGKLDWIENIVGKNKIFETGIYECKNKIDLSDEFLNIPKIILNPGKYYIETNNSGLKITEIE